MRTARPVLEPAWAHAALPLPARSLNPATRIRAYTPRDDPEEIGDILEPPPPLENVDIDAEMDMWVVAGGVLCVTAA